MPNSEQIPQNLSDDGNLIKAHLATITCTNASDWYLVNRARFGMEVVFGCLELGEIITQPFTCATAVNPILAAGHTPRYSDISYENISIDPIKIQLSDKTRAVVVQHSFGLEGDVTGVKSLVKSEESKALIIEDSAHKLGLMSRTTSQKGLVGTPLADVSIHSFGVEKLLSTKFGGAIWINPEMENQNLRCKLNSALEVLPTMSKLQNFRAKHYTFTFRVLNHLPGCLSKPFSALLRFLRLYEPAVSDKETRGINDGEARTPGSYIIDKMLENIKKYDEIVDDRRTVGELVAQALIGNETYITPTKVYDDSVLCRVPIICPTAKWADSLFEHLQKKGHYIGKWYRPLFFPGVEFSDYNYTKGECPVAEDISSRIINIPTNNSIEKIKEIVNEITSYSI
jgi:dTDP-4-amino-4,6-dideoxygalactose transaminase